MNRDITIEALEEKIKRLEEANEYNVKQAYAAGFNTGLQVTLHIIPLASPKIVSEREVVPTQTCYTLHPDSKDVIMEIIKKQLEPMTREISNDILERRKELHMLRKSKTCVIGI